MASAPADKETAKETTGYWSGYVRRMRGDSSGGGAAPAAPGRLDPPPATVLSPPPAKGSRGLGATAGRHAPSPESASALASAKSAPLRESSGRSSDIYGRPEWDPLFTSTCSFRGRASVSPAPSALSDPGVDILFAECTSKLQHLEYSALLLLMAAQEAKGRLPDDGEAPVDLPEAEFDREAAKEAWDALKRHQAAAAQRWSLQQSRGGGGSGGGSGGGGSSAAASGGGGGSGGGGPSGGGSGATEASDGGSSHSAAGLLRQRYIGSES